jgi:transcriptional regulator with PAS, ATPase and Fis domain
VSDFGLKEGRSPETIGLATQATQANERRRAADVGVDSGRRPETGSLATTEADEHNLQNIESKHIARLLKLHNGNRRQVATVLGISQRTMYRKLKRYGLT